MTFSLSNPSNITITVGDINFDVIMNEFSAVVGKVYVKDAIIPPGAKTFTAQMHLGEAATNDKAIGQLFSDYLTSASIPLTISGSKTSTTIPPLAPALAAVKLASTMTGIDGKLISGIAVEAGLIGILQKKADSKITLRNPLQTPFSINSVEASVTFKPSSGAAPFTVGTINYKLPTPVTVPAGGTTQTDAWTVSVDANLLQLLGMIVDPQKYFDVTQNVTVTVGGSGGYNTQMYYYQDHVPFTISVAGLPPIGISPQSLSKMSLPSNITSITDVAELEKLLSQLLSGQTPTSALPSSSIAVSGSSIPSGSVSATSTTGPSATTTADVSTATTTKAAETSAQPTKTETTTEKETVKVTAASATPTEEKATTSNEKSNSDEEKATTTTAGLKFDLPF